MSSIYGENLKLSIFGQSHGPAVGMTLDGIPSGLPVNEDALAAFMARRAPGTHDYTTIRKEPDKVEFLSGIIGGYTCGAPITAIIRNQDVDSSQYDDFKETPRPGHADYTAQIKHSGYQDVTGGGHFSGRLTASMCIAGGLCLQWLESAGIRIGAHITQIGNAVCDGFNPVHPQLEQIGHVFPTLTAAAAEEFQNTIAAAKEQDDSVGGRIECAVTGLPAGFGCPIFGGVESRIAQIIYGIPAVKAIGFGLGQNFASLYGSESNDPFTMDEGRITTETNHCGGILGGITNGMPVIFDVTFKPTPSIGKPQQTVNIRTGEITNIHVKGRHDPCIVPRAVPVVESAAAIAAFDMFLERNGGL